MMKKMADKKRQENDHVLDESFLYDLVSSFGEGWKKYFIHMGVTQEVIKNNLLNQGANPLEQVMFELVGGRPLGADEIDRGRCDQLLATGDVAAQ